MKTIPRAEPCSLLLSLTLISIYGIFHAVHSILDTIANTLGSILDTLADALGSVLDTFADTVRGIEEQERKIAKQLDYVLGISAKVTLVEPKSLARSEGKAVRVIDKRKLHD